MFLFKCNTIEQFQIQSFLIKEGLHPQAVEKVSFPDRSSVKITDATGAQMIVRKSAVGVYDFEYLINGVKSEETRTNFDESAVRMGAERGGEANGAELQ